jgi:transposase
MLYAGLEIASRELVVCMKGTWSRFSNDRSGHRKLLHYLTKRGEVRVCLEATGNYHLDVSLALHSHPRVQLQVLNPWVSRRFAEARLQRAKTDRVDAAALADYAERMPHQEWNPPRVAYLSLRAITRRMLQLADRKSSEGSRLHAICASEALPVAVVESVREDLAHLDAQLATLQVQARDLVRSDEVLEQLFELLVDIPGIAERSALYLLGELAPIAQDMSARQLVAHAGLDPRPIESGTSVHKPRQISKRGNARLRHILFMTALVASRHDLHFSGFYAALLSRQKSKRAALVAVMRKQLHAICGIWRTKTRYDGARLFPRLHPTLKPIGDLVEVSTSSL